MKPLDDRERHLAEAAARVIMKAEEIGLPDLPEKLVSAHAIRFLARSYIELCDQIRALHDLIDQTDPNDPIGVALTKAGLAQRPRDWAAPTGPQIVRTPAEAAKLPDAELVAIYCRVMNEPKSAFVQHESYIVRIWDGMDGCWSDCTGEVGRGEALRYWAEKTDGGTRRVSFSEIDYYRIFPGGTRMTWDGSEGREMLR